MQALRDFLHYKVADAFYADEETEKEWDLVKAFVEEKGDKVEKNYVRFLEGMQAMNREFGVICMLDSLILEALLALPNRIDKVSLKGLRRDIVRLERNTKPVRDWHSRFTKHKPKTGPDSKRRTNYIRSRRQQDESATGGMSVLLKRTAMGKVGFAAFAAVAIMAVLGAAILVSTPNWTESKAINILEYIDFLCLLVYGFRELIHLRRHQ